MRGGQREHDPRVRVVVDEPAQRRRRHPDREPEGGRNRSPLDIPGVVLSALGLVSLVYGVTRDESSGWSAPSTIGMFGVFLFLTYYLQVVEGYSAIRTGLAYLPIAISFIVGATQIGTRLATRLPARMFMVPGFAVAVRFTAGENSF